MDRARVRFFRRIAVALSGFFVLAVSGIAMAVWLIAQRVGAPGWATVLAAAFVLLAAGTAVITMFRAMRRFASPFGEVMEAADRVADGDYTVRVQEHGPPPMRALSHSFNTMTTRLQHADRLRRNLMADLAHELRTPLTVLQGRLEGLLDGVYMRDDRQIAELLDETQILSRLVEDLRTLALSDAGELRLQKEAIDLVDLVENVVHSMHAEARRKPVTLAVSKPGTEIVANLDPVRIREVITNLLSNAIRHTPADGLVTITISSSSNGTATVTVADSGIGMAAHDVAHAFDRFYKGAESRGSGLGLPIAKGIVTAHGGDITAVSESGKGTAVTFTLPRWAAGD
jgi:signal transduction histidine kinase